MKKLLFLLHWLIDDFVYDLNFKGYDDRTNPMDLHVGALADQVGLEAAPIPAQLFGAAGIEHMKKYGTKDIHMGKIAWKNHKHSVNNP